MKTLLDSLRQEKIMLCTRISNHLNGSLAEVGVFKGGSAEIIARNKHPKKKLYLFDTFNGMPEVNPNKDNQHKKGDFNKTSYDKIKKKFENYQNVFVCKGIFPKENNNVVKKENFSFVHIDVDIYQSYKDCLEFFYPRMIKGGIMVFDDYGAKSCEGAKLAIDEFFTDKPENLIWPTACQICIIKAANETINLNKVTLL